MTQLFEKSPNVKDRKEERESERGSLVSSASGLQVSVMEEQLPSEHFSCRFQQRPSGHRTLLFLIGDQLKYVSAEHYLHHFQIMEICDIFK